MLLQFWGSAAGALFVRSSPWKALQRGFALQLVAALGIYLVPVHWLFLCFGMLGLSLGMIMTATSILVARIFFQRKGSALAILNVFWGLGAMLCPAIVSRVPAGVSFRTVYTPAFVISIFFLIAFSGAHRVLAVHIQTLPHHDSASVRRIIVQSSLLAFLYVGVESSLGNWISTYSHRHFSLPFAQSALSLTCFWAFLLAGRLLTPLLLKRISEASLSLIATWVTAVSVCFTVFVHSDLLYIALISIAGLSLAPIYPLILSSLLTRAEGSPYTGWVFTMAGCGGGLLSWLSGEVSSSFGSLRIGLFVPTVAALFLAVFTLFFSQQEAPLAH
jgi:FHS family glucose/mannose:H+ symporter-like MFS transporter